MTKERWFSRMKKILAMVLLTVMCIGLCVGTAQADWLSQFIGYWEVQNMAIGGRTYGANYLGFKMTAAVHWDGIMIVTLDEEMMASYINGYGNKYYLNEGDDTVNLYLDSQGRMHLEFPDEDTTLDVRMRKVTASKVSTTMSKYVGEWELTAQDAKEYGEVTMSLYNDGFGVIVTENGLLAVRMSQQGGKFCLVDNEGLIMSVKDNNGVISFTIEYSDGTSSLLHMTRTN